MLLHAVRMYVYCVYVSSSWGLMQRLQKYSEEEDSAMIAPEYRIVGTIATGAFSVVRRIVHVDTQQHFALKVIDKLVTSLVNEAALTTEIEVHHPSLALQPAHCPNHRYCGWCSTNTRYSSTTPSSRTPSSISSSNSWKAVSCCRRYCRLFVSIAYSHEVQLSKKEALQAQYTENDARSAVQQITAAVAHLHQLGTCHSPL
jgi:serine/threonine protein kinase